MAGTGYRTLHLALVVLVGYIACIAGCSVLFVERPPPFAQTRAEVDCTDSYSWPVIDTVSTVAVVATTVLLALPSSAGSTRDSSVSTTTGTLVGGMLLGSALWGYSSVHGCREAQRRSEVYQNRVRNSPPRQPSPEAAAQMPPTNPAP